jgi:hypothetical protein
MHAPDPQPHSAPLALNTLVPRSRATCTTVTQRSRTNPTASPLNSRARTRPAAICTSGFLFHLNNGSGHPDAGHTELLCAALIRANVALLPTPHQPNRLILHEIASDLCVLRNRERLYCKTKQGTGHAQGSSAAHSHIVAPLDDHISICPALSELRHWTIRHCPTSLLFNAKMLTDIVASRCHR